MVLKITKKGIEKLLANPNTPPQLKKYWKKKLEEMKWWKKRKKQSILKMLGLNQGMESNSGFQSLEWFKR